MSDSFVDYIIDLNSPIQGYVTSLSYFTELSYQGTDELNALIEMQSQNRPLRNTNQTWSPNVATTRITEIPASQYVPTFGEKGDSVRNQWYSKIGSYDRANRLRVESAVTAAYVHLLDLPAPTFVWGDSPDHVVAQRAQFGQHESLTDKFTKFFDGISDLCTKQFHSVLAQHLSELCGKDPIKATNSTATRQEQAKEVFERVFENSQPISTVMNPVFLWVKVLLKVFVADNPEKFSDLQLTPERQVQVLNLIEALHEVYAIHLDTDVCCLYERPAAVHREDTPRGLQLHNENGPAISFADGNGQYMLDGIVVPKHVVTAPETITIDEIEKNDNSEVRRLMIERRGVGWYLSETRAEVIHMDTVKVFDQTATIDPDDRALAMPRALLKDKAGRMYLCGTDGSTNRVYYMMCPGNVKTCAEAHNQLSGGLDERKCVAQS